MAWPDSSASYATSPVDHGRTMCAPTPDPLFSQKGNRPMNTKKLTRMALLTAVALIIFMVEAQIPPPVPVPGVKLGLANIVTVYAMFALSPAQALAILVCRVFLGSVFSGQLMTLFYSLGGGLLCWCVMLLLRRVLTRKQIWVAGVFGAIVHNFGQILVASALTRTPALIVYLPVLTLSGILTGAFTGTAAQALVNRMDRLTPGK